METNSPGDQIMSAPRCKAELPLRESTCCGRTTAADVCLPVSNPLCSTLNYMLQVLRGNYLLDLAESVKTNGLCFGALKFSEFLKVDRFGLLGG